MHPLLQRVELKRLIRSWVYRRRSEMALKMLESFAGHDFGELWIRVDWGPLLPQDRTRLVQQERSLVEAGIHSRRRAIERLGVADPDSEQQTIRRESEKSAAENTNKDQRSHHGKGTKREQYRGI